MCLDDPEEDPADVNGGANCGRKQKTNAVLAIFVSFLLVANGTLILYATLLWPQENGGEDNGSEGDPLFIVGVFTFVICFTLPFLLVIGFMICMHQCGSCSGCRATSSSSAAASSAAASADAQHKLHLLPPDFVEAAAAAASAPAKTASIRRGSRSNLAGNKRISMGEDLLENHYRREMSSNSRSSARDSAAFLLPKVTFFTAEDGTEVMTTTASASDNTCSPVTTDV